MFDRARLTLTAWFVLLVMLVSVVFSVGVYQAFSRELQRSLHRQYLRFVPNRVIPGPNGESFWQEVLPFFSTGDTEGVDTQIFEEARLHLLGRLVLINVLVFLASASTGFILAGKTLEPLERSLTEQKRFVADASHELKTPLTSLKTEIEVALRGKLTLTEAKKLLASNLEEVDRLNGLATRLLQLSGASKLTMDKKVPVALDRLLRQGVERFATRLAEKKITLKSDLVPLKTNGDAGALRELIEILLDNAIKYSEPKSTIFLSLEKEKGKAIVRVRDQGRGMRASDLPHIFTRFYRADHSRSSDGFGLGLAIAHDIVEAHHGSIEVESVLSKGSVFTVKLAALENVKGIKEERE